MPVAQRELMWARWAAAITACDFATSEPIAQHLHQRAQVTDDPVERRLGLHVWAIQSWHHGRLLESAAAFEAAARTPAPEVDDRGDTLLSFERERLLVDRAFPPIVHEDLGEVESSRAELDRIAEGLDPYGDALVRCFSCSPALGAGDHARVAERARPVVEAETEFMLSFWGARLRMQLGWVDVLEGRVDEGVALFEAGHAVYAGAGLRTALPALLANMSMGLLARAGASRPRTTSSAPAPSWTAPARAGRRRSSCWARPSWQPPGARTRRRCSPWRRSGPAPWPPPACCAGSSERPRRTAEGAASRRRAGCKRRRQPAVTPRPQESA
jgi:hypothetical protein